MINRNLLFPLISSAVLLAPSVCISAENIEISIKPGGEPNSINLASKGVIPIAILGSDTFDATQIDQATIVFEHTVPPYRVCHLDDVNDDGKTDLVCHFRTKDLVFAGVIAPGDTEACVTGYLVDGSLWGGCDAIRIVPPE